MTCTRRNIAVEHKGRIYNTDAACYLWFRIHRNDSLLAAQWCDPLDPEVELKPRVSAPDPASTRAIGNPAQVGGGAAVSLHHLQPQRLPQVKTSDDGLKGNHAYNQLKRPSLQFPTIPQPSPPRSSPRRPLLHLSPSSWPVCRTQTTPPLPSSTGMTKSLQTPARRAVIPPWMRVRWCRLGGLFGH